LHVLVGDVLNFMELITVVENRDKELRLTT